MRAMDAAQAAPEFVQPGDSGATNGNLYAVSSKTGLDAPKPVRTDEELWAEKLSVVVGAKKAPYYLKQFSKLDDPNVFHWSPNWPVAVVGWMWFLYRRMYWVAAALLVLTFSYPYVTLFAVSFAKALGVSPVGLRGIMAVGMVVAGLVWLLPVALSNRLYYRYCRARIRKAEELTSDPDACLDLLEEGAGPKGIGFVVTVVLVIAISWVALSVMATVALRDKPENVVDRLYGKSVALAQVVQSEFARGNFVPERFNDQAVASFLRRLDGNHQDGTLSFDVTTGAIRAVPSVRQLNGGALYLVPKFGGANGDERILGWQCVSPDIDPKWLPSQCVMGTPPRYRLLNDGVTPYGTRARPLRRAS